MIVSIAAEAPCTSTTYRPVARRGKPEAERVDSIGRIGFVNEVAAQTYAGVPAGRHWVDNQGRYDGRPLQDWLGVARGV